MSKIVACILTISIVVACACFVSADSSGTNPLQPVIPFQVMVIGNEVATIDCPVMYEGLQGLEYYHTTYNREPIAVGLDFYAQPNIPYVSGQYRLSLDPPSALSVSDVRIFADDIPVFLLPQWADALMIYTADSYSGTISIRGLDGTIISHQWTNGGGASAQATTILGGSIWSDAIAQFGANSAVWVSFDISCSTSSMPDILYYGGNPEIVSAQILGAFSGALVDAHDAGYSEGFADGSSGDWFGGLGGSVGAFLEMELLPNFSFANVLFVVIGLGILAFVLKLLFV